MTMDMKASINNTRKGFEKSFADVDFYNRQTHDSGHLKKIFDCVRISKGMRILDLGTGRGYLSFPIAKKNPGCDVIGLDTLNIDYTRFISWLVAEVRKQNLTNDSEGFSSAIDRAITAMPEDFVIKPFLINNRAEVKGMLLTEYNEMETMELFKEEGRQEGIQKGLQKGRKEGRKEGIMDTLVSLVKDKILSVTDAASRAGMTPDEFEQAAGMKP